MAGETGLEPATFAVTGRRCNQLNYSPAKGMQNKIKNEKNKSRLGDVVYRL